MAKLFGSGDIKVISDNPNSKGNWISPDEMRQVLSVVNNTQYILYSAYRTFPFKEASEISDECMATSLNWSKQVVQKSRLALEAANLFKTIRYGSTAEGITKMLVGSDVVALYNAGLPSEILNGKALSKLRRCMDIKDTATLLHRLPEILQEYELNTEKYI